MSKRIDILLFQVVWNIELFKLVYAAQRGTDCRLISAVHGLPGQFFYNLKKYIEREKPRNCKERIIKCFKPVYLSYVYHKFKKYNHFIYDRSDAFVALTEANRRNYMDFYRIKDTGKFTVIPNPLSYDEFIDAGGVQNKEKTVLVRGEV